MARYMAKNIVASGLLTECEIQLAYAIGKPEPISFNIRTKDENSNDIINKILNNINSFFDCTPRGIIEELDLLKPIYRKTASYGHFGRNDQGFKWEEVNKSELIKKI
tara:strand:- start:175 stop:495 length:321 start_codon:yes stop_codon:yes gene_type:complete